MAVSITAVNRSTPGDGLGDTAYDGTGIINTNFTNLKNAVDLVLDLSQNNILGRATVGTGNPEKLTATQVRTILNVADGANNYSHPNHSGQVTSTGDGAQVLTVTAISAQTALASGLAGADETLVNDGGVLKKVAFSVVATYMQGALAHNSFSDYVANEHINWTNTSSNFLTTGTATAATVYAGNPTLTTDDQFMMTAGDAVTPRLNMDSGDYYQYDRTNNEHEWFIGSTQKMLLDANADLWLG